MRKTLWGRYGMGRLVILGVAMLMLATGVSAQSTTSGAIGGTVRDPSGSVIPSASVSALNVGTNIKTTATSDGNGRFVVANLQPGSYTLEASVTGFSAFKQENIVVEVGRLTPVNVNLTIAAQTTTVVAVAESPVLTTTSPEVTTNFNQVAINNLPNNLRRWSFFALGTPGAVPDGNFGLVSFRGISGLLNNNTVDGGDNNQAFFAEEKGRTRISYSTSASAIQEFQVNTSNYSSEYGRSAGGVVNAITKSGSNSYHGDGFWYFRNSDWGAFNPFQTVSTLVGGTLVTTPVKPKDKRHQFGGTVGGPIIKDKLFFFFSADQQKRNFPGIANAGVPAAMFGALTTTGAGVLNETATLTTVNAARNYTITLAQANAAIAFLQGLSGQVARRGDQLILFPKIDWIINTRNQFSASYNRMRWNSPAGIQTQPVVFRGVESFGDDFVKGDSLKLRWNSTFSPTILNEFRFQYGRDFEFQNSQPSVAGEPVSAQGVSPQIQVISGGNFVFGKPNFLERKRYPDEKNYQYSDTLSWNRGQHNFKFGMDINRVHDVLDNLFQEAGAYNYSRRVDFISDYVAFVNGLGPACGTVAVPAPCYSTFGQNFGPTAFKFRTIDFGFFAQDDWRISSHLTVNLGLRYEYEKLPEPQIPLATLPDSFNFPRDRNNLGPRIGAAWDLTGHGKAVIRGGYGIYYGRVINSTISNAITNTGSTLGQLSFSFSGSAAAATGRPIYPNVVATAPPPGATPPDVVVFKNRLQWPLIHQYDAVFEYQVARNTAVSVRYIGSLGRDLPVFLDANLNPTTSTITYLIVNGPKNGQSFTFPLYKGPRPNTNFGRITTIADTVNSTYNALAIQFEQRMTKGLQFQTFYTFSHSNDNGQSSQTFTASNNVLDRFNMDLEQGRSNFDTRHRFGASAVWAPEYFKDRTAVVRAFADGWSIAPIVSFATGAPYTGSVSGNAPSGSCGPALVPAFPCQSLNGAGGSNRPPFEVRNAYESPRTIFMDLRVSKSFRIVEGVKFEAFGDFFNLFNHRNITSIQTTLYSTGGTAAAPTLTYNSTFGTPTASSNTLIAQRQIQIGLRVSF
jgi:outer membrane receptor protein involved in Fe transport